MEYKVVNLSYLMINFVCYAFAYHIMFLYVCLCINELFFNILIFCNIVKRDAGHIVYIHVKFEMLVCGFHDKPIEYN